MAKHASENQYYRAVDLSRHDPEAGAQALGELAQRYPSDSRVLHAYGVSLLQIGQAAKALTALEAAAKREKQYVSEVQESLAQAYSALGMTQHAIRAWRRTGKDLPGDATDDSPFSGDVPVGAKTADFLEFERARMQILSGETASGVKQMEQFAKRFPAYLPAQNVLATGAYLLGDLAKSRQLGLGVLSEHPRNIYALLNLIRLELLEHGLDAARALAEQLAGAAVSFEEGVVDGELARASAYALLEDDAGVRRSLDAWEPDAEIRAEHPQAGPLEERYQERQAVAGTSSAKSRFARKKRPEPAAALPDHLGQPPYLTLQKLLPPAVIPGWAKVGQLTPDAAFASLRAFPGLLSLLPERLGFDHSDFVRAMAMILLDHTAPNSPAPDRPAPDYAELLRGVVQHGPGTTEVRLALGALLQERELLPETVMTDLAGSQAGGQLLQLEIHDEVSPSPMTRSELKRFERSLNWMRQGKWQQAIALLEPLAAAYPDDKSAAFNLSIAEKHSGDSEFMARSQQRLQELAGRYPQYLFPRSELASEALERGDLEEAGRWLAFPEGLRRIHQQEYSTFMSVQGRLMIKQGNPDAARELLDMIEQVSGEQSAAYILLERALPSKAGERLSRRPFMRRR